MIAARRPLWLAWNEPNNPVFLTPAVQEEGGKWRVQSAVVYAKICNAVDTGIHSTRLSGEKVACGVTAPRGNNTRARPRPSVSPLVFLRALKKARAFDVYAHHPYYSSPSDRRPAAAAGARPRSRSGTSTTCSAAAELYARKHLWITEYGYQTNPPDRSSASRYAKQAPYLTQAYAIARRNPQIDMMVWFLAAGRAAAWQGWQSGF